MKYLKLFEEIEVKDVSDHIANDLHNFLIDLEDEGDFKVSIIGKLPGYQLYKISNHLKSIGYENLLSSCVSVLIEKNKKKKIRDISDFKPSELQATITRMYDMISDHQNMSYYLTVFVTKDEDFVITTPEQLKRGYILSCPERGNLKKGVIYTAGDDRPPGWFRPGEIKINGEWHAKYLFKKLSDIDIVSCYIIIDVNQCLI